jgi:thioredoxin-like negative regulator of GroEL
MTQRLDEKRDSSSAEAPPLNAFARLGEGAYHARLVATPGVAVVLFSAAHCGSCRVWRRLLPAAMAGIADVLFEVDVGEATGVARDFGIFHLPTVYLYRDGRFHAELQCEARPEAVRQAARRLLDAAPQDEPG